MMALGAIASWEASEDDVFRATIEPWLCKGRVLAHQTTDWLLEGILRQMPFDIESTGVLKDLTSTFQIFFLLFSCDRASANFSSLFYIWDRIVQSRVLGIVPHCEPCASHGVPLAKGRCPIAKDLLAASFSFTRFMRYDRNVQDIRASVERVVSASLVIIHGSPSAARVTFVEELIAQIFGSDDDATFMYKWKKGVRTKTAFHNELTKVLLAMTAVGWEHEGALQPRGRWVHYCIVEPGSKDETVFGKRPLGTGTET